MRDALMLPLFSLSPELLPSPSPPSESETSPSPILNPAAASLLLLPQTHAAVPALRSHHCRCSLGDALLLLPRGTLPLVLPRGRVVVVKGGLPQEEVVVATKARLPGMTVNVASTKASTLSSAGERGGNRAVIGIDDEAHGAAAVATAAVAGAERARRFMTRFWVQMLVGLFVVSSCTPILCSRRLQAPARVYC